MSELETLPPDAPTLHPSGSALETIAGDVPQRREPARPLQRGAMLGRYVVLDTIGRGGMGVVYAAYDPELDRKVAIKLLRPALEGGAAARQRLQREAQAIAKLSHPNVIQVHDVGVVDERVFIAMEYVDGPDLRRWLGERDRSVPEIVECLRQAGAGLVAAHDAGLVHRDFKPDNVLVGRDGRVRVLDFGLARTSESGEAARDDHDPSLGAARQTSGPDLGLTVTGALLGTPGYMSPEQFSGLPGDARSDQFSFCVTAFEALHGERPFAGETVAQLSRAVLRGEIVATTSASVSPRLRRVLVRGLDVDPSRRHADMHDLLVELQRAMAPQRGRWLLAGAGAALLGGAALWMTQSPESTDLCEVAVARASAVFDDARRAAIGQRFRAVDRPFAADTWTRVQAGLDEHLQQWAQQQQQVCEAARLDDASPVLEDRQRCLDQRLREVAVVVELFDEASEETVIGATKLVDSLSDVELCRGDDYATRRPIPVDPAQREQVMAIYAELDRVRVLWDAGEREDAKVVLDQVWDRAEALDYHPLSAEISMWRGSLLSTTGEVEEAMRLAEIAFNDALAGRHDWLALSTATDMVHYYGVLRREREPAEAWAKRAEALLHRLGDEETEAIKLYNSWAAMESQTGQHAEAKARYLALVERARRLERPLMMQTVLNNTGNVLAQVGEFEAAAETLRESLEIAEGEYGPDHPIALRTQANLGALAVMRGDYAEGRKLLEELLPRQEAVIGVDHPEVANTLESIAIAMTQLGEAVQSEPLRLRLIAIREKHYGLEGVPTLHALSNLMTLRYAQGRDEESAALGHELLQRLQRREQPVASLQSGVLVVLADLALARGDAVQALAHARAAEVLCALPDGCTPAVTDWTAVLMGEARLAAGDREQALATLEPLLGAKPKSDDLAPPVRLRFALARAWIEDPARHDEALAMARQARKQVPSAEFNPRSVKLGPIIDRWIAEHERPADRR